jgi:uncharacterized protein (DUF983 family)
MARSIFVIARKRSQLLNGRWYLGPACKACGEKLAILEDTERGGRAFDLGDTMLRMVCPHCGAEGHTYRADEVQSFEHLLHA